jgi:hypothetical protein
VDRLVPQSVPIVGMNAFEPPAGRQLAFLKSKHLVQSIRNLELTGVGRPFVDALGDRLDHQAVRLFDARS